MMGARVFAESGVASGQFVYPLRMLRADPVWQLLQEPTVNRRKKVVAAVVLTLFLAQALFTISSSRQDEIEITVVNRTSQQIAVSHSPIWESGSGSKAANPIYVVGTIDWRDPELLGDIPPGETITDQFVTASPSSPDKVRHHFEAIGEDKTWILALSREQLKSDDFTVVLDE
jgi:hypothetical protein